MPRPTVFRRNMALSVSYLSDEGWTWGLEGWWGLNSPHAAAVLTAENVSWHFPVVGLGRWLSQWWPASQVMESMTQVYIPVHMGEISQGPTPEEKLQDFNGCRNGESVLSRDEPGTRYLIPSAHPQTHVSDLKQTQQVVFMNVHPCVFVLEYLPTCNNKNVKS